MVLDAPPRGNSMARRVEGELEERGQVQQERRPGSEGGLPTIQSIAVLLQGLLPFRCHKRAL